ncbi:hypothetical protein N8T08_006693 [Aspergillus melleus]|uniref:Uncharacterized protein n=1 Tax=Aspergillus melleus TaxID=138277 RepID=A0ACC3AZU1_9EURO|nr:hypothetical protein N8T08_006693 [Aspergillus melleus]
MDDSQGDRARFSALEEKLRKAAEENSLLAAENSSPAKKNRQVESSVQADSQFDERKQAE